MALASRCPTLDTPLPHALDFIDGSIGSLRSLCGTALPSGFIPDIHVAIDQHV